MHERRRRFATMVVLCFSLMISACAEEAALPDDADAELLSGAEVYRARCSSCHGANGGGAIGPSLRQIDDRLDDAEQRAVVVDGRRSMPSFSGVLSDADILAVVRYTREVL